MTIKTRFRPVPLRWMFCYAASGHRAPGTMAEVRPLLVWPDVVPLQLHAGGCMQAHPSTQPSVFPLGP